MSRHELRATPSPDMNGEVYLIKDLAPFVFNLAAAAGRAPKEMKYGEGGFAIFTVAAGIQRHA